MVFQWVSAFFAKYSLYHSLWLIIKLGFKVRRSLVGSYARFYFMLFLLYFIIRYICSNLRHSSVYWVIFDGFCDVNRHSIPWRYHLKNGGLRYSKYTVKMGYKWCSTVNHVIILEFAALFLSPRWCNQYFIFFRKTSPIVYDYTLKYLKLSAVMLCLQDALKNILLIR